VGETKSKTGKTLDRVIPPLGGNLLGRPASGPAGRFMRPIVKPKAFKKTAKRLWGYFKTEQKILILISLSLILSCTTSLVVPYYMGEGIDVLSESGIEINFALLKVIVFTLLAAYCIELLMNVLQGFMMAGITRRVVVKLRSNLFSKLQKLPIAFFDTHTHGEVMSRLTNDIENVSQTISQSTTQLIAGILTIIGAFVMMVVLSPLLTITSLLTAPLVFLLSKTIAKRTRVYFKNQQIELGKLNGCIEETIAGMHVIKAFSYEQKVIEKFDSINYALFKQGLKAQIWSGFLMPMMNVINNLGFVAIALLGGVLAIKDLISIGVIASFLSYSKQFTRPLNDLANIFNTLQSGVAGAERVFEILDEKEEEVDKQGAVVLEHPKGDVQFQNVSFGYRSETQVLNEISFTAKAGSSTALVGATGSGKTTLVNLLSRFYDTTGGQIIIDGHDIRDYTRDSLRKCFGIVLQDTYLFNGTVKENIRYGNLDATDEEITRAAKMANAHVFITRLKEGYATVLAESGSNLSEGQRQLLAIARAILVDPPILILDEATSNVDTRTELHIQEALLELMKERTSFIIAHRLSTIRDVSRIIVIDQGKIVEIGNHKELMALKGRYYKLYHTQFENMND